MCEKIFELIGLNMTSIWASFWIYILAYVLYFTPINVTK